jgi:uncharacterized protein (DUF58 family)
MLSDLIHRMYQGLDEASRQLPEAWRPSRYLDWLTANGRLHVGQKWLLLLGPILLILSLFLPYRWLYVVSYSYLFLSLACYAWVRYQMPRIQVVRRVENEWAQVGDRLQESWVLRNPTWLPLLWLELDDESELPGYVARRVVASGPFSTTNWVTEAICARRGLYSLGPLRLRGGDPFGMFFYNWHDTATYRIIIYPPLVRLPAITPPQGQQGGLQRADLLQQFATPSVGGLREYRPGDMPSHIHWATVARTGNLMVKEFDQERAGSVWIVLDLDHSLYSYNSDGVSSVLEYGVLVAASLAAQLLAEGRSVGLLADDGASRALAPAQGPRQLWTMLGSLVDVNATSQRSLADVLRRWRQAQNPNGGRSKSALIVITPDLTGLWQGALAETAPRAGALVIGLSAGEAGQSQQIAQGLAAMGLNMQVLDSTVELPRVNPLRPREELRSTPLGKVVKVTRRAKSS